MVIEKYIKQSNNEEISNILYLERQGLNTILPNYTIQNNYITYKKESLLPVAAKYDLSTFESIYSDTLAKLYNIKQKNFSSGIYSYLNESYPIKHNFCNQNYFFLYENLVFDNLCREHSITKCNNRILDDFYEWVHVMFNKYLDYPIHKFTLLHGDFHLGNILYSKEKRKYLLIDFEHMRYGLPEMEMANFIVQLLDGGEYVAPYYAKYLEFFSNAMSKLNFNFCIIYELFIPLFLFFRIWRCVIGVNDKQILVRDYILSVAEKYLNGDYDECVTNNSSNIQ